MDRFIARINFDKIIDFASRVIAPLVIVIVYSVLVAFAATKLIV